MAGNLENANRSSMMSSSKHTSTSLTKARLGKLEKCLGESETKDIAEREEKSHEIVIQTSLYAINTPEERKRDKKVTAEVILSSRRNIPQSQEKIRSRAEDRY